MMEDFLRYSILDPGGNITLLVESNVQIKHQPDIAADLMKKHPLVEQVGFVKFPADENNGELPELRMAGGEFCGNASLCAALLYYLNKEPANSFQTTTVRLQVSSASDPVKVCLLNEEDGVYTAGILMPAALDISLTDFLYNNSRASLPVVRMEGICHIIIEESSMLFELINNREAAENAVKQWCEELEAPGLGLMFLKKNGSSKKSGASGGFDTSGTADMSGAADTSEASYDLTPLVYIPGSDTVFWEHSCASGTSAAGMYLGSHSDEPSSFVFSEPGGTLKTDYDPASGELWLYNKIRVFKH